LGLSLSFCGFISGFDGAEPPAPAPVDGGGELIFYILYTVLYYIYNTIYYSLG
jgi:hypothetical protein